ncbi:unnamed protein product [Hermetia illucens]|uniref:Uncharacterized protein n=1 Tax=Hermetia illucens TaxID=343691 RepID=A0A7R8UI21_HERIL|nr:unnamed protein product [Hermetia illucens]
MDYISENAPKETESPFFSKKRQFICSVYEFLTVYHGNKCLSTFRSRRFYVLPGVFRRNSRLIGAAFMAKFYLLMLLGVIMLYPPFLIPYLTIQAVSLGMDLVLWALDLVMDDEFLSLTTLVSYLFFIVTWTFVQCVKEVFEDAIRNGDTSNLSLIKI